MRRAFFNSLNNHDCLCGGEWRSLRTDREAGPAELSYCDITLNTSFITFQLEESGCGRTEKDPFSVREGGGKEDVASFNWGTKLQLLFIFLFPLKIVRVVLDFVFFPYRPIQKRNRCLSLEYKRRQCLPHPSTPLHITIPCLPNPDPSNLGRGE